MAETIVITSIVVASTALVGVIGKLLHTMRHNIKNCWGIQFRSRSSSPDQERHRNDNEINMRQIEHDAMTSDIIFPSNVRSMQC